MCNPPLLQRRGRPFYFLTVESSGFIKHDSIHRDVGDEGVRPQRTDLYLLETTRSQRCDIPV
jgi:hypothetical protein